MGKVDHPAKAEHQAEPETRQQQKGAVDDAIQDVDEQKIQIHGDAASAGLSRVTGPSGPSFHSPSTGGPPGAPRPDLCPLAYAIASSRPSRAELAAVFGGGLRQ